MNDYPLVSIAMSTYNGECYIRQQIDSILSQTYPNLELVIVDDCSTDNTYSILQEYANKHDNINLLRNDANLGVSQSFSRSLMNTNGQFIALSDQDDVWFNYKIVELVNNIGDNMLIHSDAVIVNDQLKVLYKSHFKFSKNPNWSTFKDYLVNVNVTGCTVMISRKLLDIAMPIPKEFVIHDWYLAIIAAYYNSIVLINKPLLYYRQHSYNVSGFRKKTYTAFMKRSAVFSQCLSSLLQLEFFSNNNDIIVMVRYWKSIADRKVDKRLLSSIWRQPHRIRLFMLIFVLVIPPELVSQKLYSFLRKFF